MSKIFDYFIVPAGWRLAPGRFEISSDAWVERGAPDDSFERLPSGSGLWGNLRGSFSFRRPPPGAELTTRRFVATWEGGGAQPGGKDMVVELTSHRVGPRR